jgi:hypothetical protein
VRKPFFLNSYQPNSIHFLKQVKLPPEYWSEEMRAAEFINNNLPKSKEKTITNEIN